jgi:hypothetical protein
MTKISIAISQTDEGTFNMVINQASVNEAGEPQNESDIKTGLELSEVKELINAL